jgi:small nuclear ribonucleoprotein (snRNP)-like protein
MTISHIELLKASVDKLIRVHCRDGETFIGRILSVSADERDVVYDLVSTSRESQYEKADRQPAYLIKFDDIESVDVHEFR